MRKNGNQLLPSSIFCLPQTIAVVSRNPTFSQISRTRDLSTSFYNRWTTILAVPTAFEATNVCNNPLSVWTRVCVSLGLYASIPMYCNTLIHIICFFEMAPAACTFSTPKGDLPAAIGINQLSSKSLTLMICRPFIGPLSCLPCYPTFGSSNKSSVFSPYDSLEEWFLMMKPQASEP